MCATCKKAKTLPPKKALDLIGKEMSKGRNPEHFKKVMDELLGTEEPEQNAALDAAWERGHRQQRGDSDG
jgi:hypothetical protein